jgi:enoyl-CoA hydratase/carnithine racemase
MNQNPLASTMSDVLTTEEIPCDGNEGAIAMVTINRPNKLNSLNQEVMNEIKKMCSWAESNEKIRCVIITGAKPLPPPEGKRQKPNAFVAGADITEFIGQKGDDIRALFKDNGWEAIWNLSKPTIAMIDGFTLGGGLEVACSCDMRVASERSVFGTPEIKLGLMPGGGGTQRLVNLIGLGKTMEMVLSGENISAQEALEIGLVNHVVNPDLLEEKTMAIAQSIASKSMHALKVAKNTIRQSLENPLSVGVAFEAEEFASLFDSEDKEIGVQAFLNRSVPEWKHR